LPAIKCTLWKGKSKAPSARASGGSRISTGKWFMDGGDSLVIYPFEFSVYIYIYLSFLFMILVEL